MSTSLHVKIYFLAKPSLEGLPEKENDNVRPTHQSSRQMRQSNFLSEVIDPEDRVCLPRYECDTQRTPSTNTLGNLGLVQDSFFKNSYLKEQVIQQLKYISYIL